MCLNDTSGITEIPCLDKPDFGECEGAAHFIYGYLIRCTPSVNDK